MQKEEFMKTALKLAEKGRGLVSPNPLVGAVLVKKGVIVGRGWHKKFGEKHAEVNAIEAAGKKARKATLYVNLEPCSHYGKQPPCVNAVIEAGIRKVVCAMKDPNPLVAGKGINKMRRAGISVETGLMKKEAENLNEAFVKWILTGKPLVTLKIAMTRDGFISWGDGKRKKITGNKSRMAVQKMRAENDAVLVGINTLLKDNPRLTNRFGSGGQPARVVLDSKLRIPLQSKFLMEKGKPIIFYSKRNLDKERKLEKKGAELERIKERNGKIPLQKVLEQLGKKGITSLLVEGGREINTSFISEGKADKLVVFMGEKRIGKGLYFVKGKKPLSKKVRIEKIERSGKDLVTEACF